VPFNCWIVSQNVFWVLCCMISEVICFRREFLVVTDIGAQVNVLLIYSDTIVLLSIPCTPASLYNCLNIHLRVFNLLVVIPFCVVFPVVFGIYFTAASFTALYHLSASLSTISLFVKLFCEVFYVILSPVLFFNRLQCAFLKSK